LTEIFQDCNCPYCKKIDKFPVLWKLNARDRYWYEVPKNGSMTIKKSQKPVRIGKDKVRELPKDTRPIVIYRDPVDRYLSLFKHYFTKEGGRLRDGISFLERVGRKDYNPEVKKQVKETFNFILDNLDKLDSKFEVHHFYPQTRFFEPDVFEDFEFIPIGKMTDILNVNTLHHTEYDGKLTPTKKQIAKIREIYAADYDFFRKRGLTDGISYGTIQKESPVSVVPKLQIKSPVQRIRDIGDINIREVIG